MTSSVKKPRRPRRCRRSRTKQQLDSSFFDTGVPSWFRTVLDRELHDARAAGLRRDTTKGARVKVRPGFPQLKLFNRLKASTRNSSVRALPTGRTRASDMSRSSIQGPRCLCSGWFPRVPAAG